MNRIDFVCLLFCLSLPLAAHSAPPEGRVFNVRARGGARAALGDAVLQNVLANHRKDASDIGNPALVGYSTQRQLEKALEQDKDLGVDAVNSRLVYQCHMRKDLGRAAAMAAEADATAAAAATATATVDPSSYPADYAAATAAAAYAVPDPAAANLTTAPPEEGTSSYYTGGNRHHHHHHRHHHHRHLLQASTTEWLNPWTPEMADRALTVAETFTLHSRPGVAKRLFLDFDGSTVINSAWNDAANTPIVTPAYDRDGDPTTFTALELSEIFAIWRYVADSFAPFDIDVTTEDPGASYPKNLWMWNSIGGDGAWYASAGSGILGVGYVDVWGLTDHKYQPSWSFMTQWTKDVWSTVAHEVGHGFGLSHDGDATNEYYGGANGWGPIMGSSWQDLIQWSKGEYAGASNTEDDCAIIASKVGWVAQAHGSSTATAVAVNATANAGGTTSTAKVLGIVRAPTDLEYTYFDAAAGTASLQALTISKWQDTRNNYNEMRTTLYMTVKVLNAAGTVISTQTGQALGPTSITLPAAGRYYLSVQGSGSGTAWTSYGSRGEYQLIITYPTSTVTPSPSPKPSPSPSPKPSPSPSPKPSPSPSPKPSPSPSPKPSPSPSPAPASFLTANTIMTNRKLNPTTTLPTVTCFVNISMVQNTTLVGIEGVTVTGKWSSIKSATGWPSATQTAFTNANGIASLTAPATLPVATGNGCTFTIASVTKAGFSLSAWSAKTGQMSW